MNQARDVKPMKYTGKRKEEYDMYKGVFRRVRDIPIDVIAGLNSKEKRAVKAKEKREAEYERKRREEEARRLEEARRNEELKKEKRKKKREEQRLISDGVLVDKIFTDPEIFSIPGGVYVELVEALDKLVGKKDESVYYVIHVNGAIADQGVMKVKGGDTGAIYWNSIKPLFFAEGYDGESNYTGNVRLTIFDRDTAPGKKVLQRYRDGPVNCVLQPLIDMWSSMRDNSESEGSRVRFDQIVRKLQGYLPLYEKGVPENEMETIAKTISRCIVIKDKLNNEYAVYNKKSSKIVSFTNTRKDHLEIGEITRDGKFEKVSREKLDEIINEHKESGRYWEVANGNFESPDNIISAKGKWAVPNPDHEIYDAFNELTGVNNYGINAVKYADLNKFILEGRVINSAPVALCDEPDNIEGVAHVDLVQAYTLANKCKFYEGFMGHVYMYGKVPAVFGDETAYATKFLADKIGIFQVMILKNDVSKLRMLGIHAGKVYTLPTPEIKAFIEMGVKMRLIAGCFGSTFHFEYTPEMLVDRRYAIWAGKLGMDSDVDTYSFKCDDDEWASHLKATLGDSNVFYFKKAHVVVVKIARKSYKTRHHILAFITSYTRLNMIDILMKLEDDQLVKVVMDGLYFRGEIPDITLPYKDDKKKIQHKSFKDAWYLESEVDTSCWSNLNMEFDKKRIVLGGQGGSGKSYSVLANKTIVNPLYVVPTHVLGQKGRKVYGCNYTTINKLIGAKTKINGKDVIPRTYKEEKGEPSVIFIDELTMIEKSWIEKAIEMYPNSMIFIAGDIAMTKKGIMWFQTRNGHPGKFSPIWLGGGHKLIEYKNDMRSRDEGLKAMKLKIREKMVELFTDGGMIDALKLSKWASAEFNAVSFDDACKMFTPGDKWIAATHKTNERLLARGIVSGYLNKEHEIVDETDENAKKYGSFTTHSFQGQTIEYGKVFVPLDCFEHAMLYTAVSRCVSIDQVVIVRN
jgi:hypothetical protein